MRTIISIIALVGLAVFGSAFIASYANPSLVETLARDAIRLEVERRVGERIDALEGGKLAEIAKRLSGQNASEIADLKRKLAKGLPQKVATVAAQMRNLNCECRKAIEKSVTGILEGRAADLSRINERLELLIRTKYMAVAESLTREFRIFTGANAFVFMLLVLASALRKRAGSNSYYPLSCYLEPPAWWAIYTSSIKTGCTLSSSPSMLASGTSSTWRWPSHC